MNKDKIKNILNLIKNKVHIENMQFKKIHKIKYFDYIVFIALSIILTSTSVTIASNQLSNPAFAHEISDEAANSLPKIESISYTVKEGDTIESIAAAHNLKVSTITASNSLTASSTLNAGKTLTFPSLNGVYYVIQSGDTLWDLSTLNNVDIDEIVRLNNLESADKLKLGKKIFVPNVENVKRLSRSSSISTSTKGIWPVNGTVTSKFGKRWGRMHEGIDIGASTGTNVYAFMSGTVIYASRDGGYGKLVVISHGNGLKSYYGHNSKILVNVGETVKRGEHIAEVGSTGNSTGPHCHFEIRKNGTPVNPFNYLR
ncbi:MAG: peptidoglycan DD-metalloendopeptidase family protein [Clostridiaceae bacterium]